MQLCSIDSPQAALNIKINMQLIFRKYLESVIREDYLKKLFK